MKRLLFAALSCLEVALLLTSTGVEAAPSQDGSEWQIETVDSLGDVGWDTSIALDDCGNPHISYYDSTEGTLKYAHWTGSAWHIEAVDDVGQGGVGYIAWDTSIALDRLGYPHISYCYSVAPNADGTLKYARWDG